MSSWRNMLSGVLPFLRNGPVDNMDVATRIAVDPHMVHWLYTWERTTSYLKETTEFERTIGHFQFTDVAGHPWCNNGYGDAMTLVVSQLMKSEVAVMLNNAAANIDNKTDGLIWDETQSRFVLSNENALTSHVLDDGNSNVDAGVIMPLLASIVTKFFDDTSMGNKMRSVTDMICQLSDAEAEAQVFDDSVYFCYVEDIVAATLICGESEQSVDCPSSLSEYAHTKEDFPSAACEVANHTLHKGAIPNQVNFSDNDLIMPLLMVDLLRSSNEKKLPRFIPTKVSMQESLTYLLLYRSCIISASFSRQPYLCGADQVKAPVLIPGWNLPKVLTMMPEGDPIFAVPTSENDKFASPKSHLKNDAVPLVFISQSSVSPCSFVITIRGTATMVEWIQDFEYGQTPFFAQSQIKTHVGFTRILSSIVPPLELFLSEQSRLHNCNCQNTHIFLTGHSLGAGVAQLLALHLALKYKEPQHSTTTLFSTGNKNSAGRTYGSAPTHIAKSNKSKQPSHNDTGNLRSNQSNSGINFGMPHRNVTRNQVPSYNGSYGSQGYSQPYTTRYVNRYYFNEAGEPVILGDAEDASTDVAEMLLGQDFVVDSEDTEAEEIWDVAGRRLMEESKDEESEYDFQYRSRSCPLDISAVVFAPPRVFNTAGSEKFRRLINGRVILDSGDGLAYMPCYEGNSKAGWPRCGADHMSRTSGQGRDHYADNYGIVEINVEYTDKRGGKTIDTLMQSIFPASGNQDEPSLLSTLFSKLVEVGIPGLGRIPSLGAMGASHVCSAACKFSQSACGSKFKWWCDKCPMLI